MSHTVDEATTRIKSLLQWLRARLFFSWSSSIATLIILYLARLLGICRRQIPVHFVRYFSRRPALAAGLDRRNTADALSAKRLT